MEHSAHLALAASTLLVDTQGAEVVATFAAADVPCIVLKGRAFAELLYPGAYRPYDDTDLLVPPTRLATAESILRRLGYAVRGGPDWPFSGPAPHARQWARAADGANIDLHERLLGTTCGAERGWQLLAAHTEPMTLAGRPARRLDRPASALMCALHLAAHGRVAKPLEDIERALRLIPEPAWRTAHAMAVELGAVEPFATGLRFSESGGRLADRLGLPRSLTTRRLLQLDTSAPSAATTLDELLSQATGLARLQRLATAIAPTPRDMRRHHPFARRGRSGLIASYLLRPARLAALVPRALVVRSRARRVAAAGFVRPRRGTQRSRDDHNK